MQNYITGVPIDAVCSTYEPPSSEKLQESYFQKLKVSAFDVIFVEAGNPIMNNISCAAIENSDLVIVYTQITNKGQISECCLSRAAAFELLPSFSCLTFNSESPIPFHNSRCFFVHQIENRGKTLGRARILGFFKLLREAKVQGGEHDRLAAEEQDRKDFELVLAAFQYRGYAKGARGIHMRLLHQDPPVRMNPKKIRRLMKGLHLVCPVRKVNPYRSLSELWGALHPTPVLFLIA